MENDLEPTMTSRDRVLHATRGEMVDHVPCCMVFNPLQKQMRQGQHWQFPWAEDASLSECIDYQVNVLGLDQVVYMGASPATLPAGRDAPDGVEVEVRLEDDILHKCFRTSGGKLCASVRYNEQWPHGMDIPFYSDFNIGHFVQPWIETERDLACFQEIATGCESPAAMDALQTRAVEARTLANRYGLALLGHVGRGLTGAQHLFGATQLCMMTLENPSLVDAYLEYEHQFNLRAIRALGECGVDIIRRNGFYETADFYGPAMLEQFVGSRIRSEVAAIREAGMLSSYTVNTGIEPILDYLAGLNVDSLFGIDIAFNDLDLNAVQEKLHRKTALWIGPSSVYHVVKGRDVTRQAVRKVFSAFGKAGLVLSPCVSVHSIMPWESAEAMIDEWRELR